MMLSMKLQALQNQKEHLSTTGPAVLPPHPQQKSQIRGLGQELKMAGMNGLHMRSLKFDPLSTAKSDPGGFQHYHITMSEHWAIWIYQEYL